MNPVESFETFYLASKDRCLRAVLATGAAPHEAEDAVAEAFARAYARWGTVSRHPAPEGWVVRTALNARVSSWRKLRREVPIEGTLGEPVVHPEGAEGLADLLAAVRALPRRQREVVALRLVLGMSSRDTAVTLGLREGTVGAHLHRAVQTLRARAIEERELAP